MPQQFRNVFLVGVASSNRSRLLRRHRHLRPRRLCRRHRRRFLFSRQRLRSWPSWHRHYRTCRPSSPVDENQSHEMYAKRCELGKSFRPTCSYLALSFVAMDSNLLLFGQVSHLLPSSLAVSLTVWPGNSAFTFGLSSLQKKKNGDLSEARCHMTSIGSIGAQLKMLFKIK